MSLMTKAILKEGSHKKYCRFKKYQIKYIDYKEVGFLKRFLNDQARILPRRITGNSPTAQKMVKAAVERARHMALLPYVADNFKS